MQNFIVDSLIDLKNCKDFMFKSVYKLKKTTRNCKMLVILT